MLVNEQAKDEGLWFIAQTAPEAYLQQELRRLHATIEGGEPLPGLDVEILARALREAATYTSPAGHGRGQRQMERWGGSRRAGWRSRRNLRPSNLGEAMTPHLSGVQKTFDYAARR